MIINGYNLIEPWKGCSQGDRAMATKGGKQYILKKYDTVEPVMNGALDAKTFEKNKERFRKFTDYRTRINRELRKIALPGGNIIAPVEEFVHEHCFIEVTEFIPGALDRSEIEGGFIATLSVKAQDMILQTMTAALMQVHAKGIAHSDLKIPNVLVVELERSEKYVAKLIDFDSSFFLSDKSESIGGTEEYMSPEQAMLFDAEDEEDIAILKEKVTEKVDIFALGMIFHMLLSGGEYPSAEALTPTLQRYKEKGIIFYTWTMLLGGCKLKLSDKIKSFRHRSLIFDMLEGEAAKRPSAEEVLKRLKEVGEDEVTLDEPWTEDRIILLKDKFAAQGLMSLTKVERGGVKCYEVRQSSGEKMDMTAKDLLAKGLARALIEEKFEDPWPEHPIRYNLEKIKSRKYIAIYRKTLGGKNGYEMFRADSTSTFVDVMNLLMMGYAIQAEKEERKMFVMKGFAEPWPEHHIRFDLDKIKSRKYVRIERVDINGVRGYYFYSESGTKKFMNVNSVLMLGYGMEV